MRSYLFLQRVSSFAGRAVVFFFVSSLLALFFYVIGNFQDFLDSTQLFLLSLLHITLVLELVSGLYLAVMLIARSVRERRFFVVRFVLVLLSMVVCSGLLLALGVIQSWLRA